MALYQGLREDHRGGSAERPLPRRDNGAVQAWRSAPRPEAAPAPVWTAHKHETHGDLSDAPFLDRLLGQGASHTLGRAVGTAIARARAPKAKAAYAPAPRPALLREVPVHRQRFQAVGAGEAPLPRGRKGVIRGLLLVLGLLAAASTLKPWQRLGALQVDVAALFSTPDPQAEAKRAALQRQQDAAEAARLAALPLEAGTGEALGLWQDGRGRWYRVDGDGLLAPGEAPGARSSLGLVQLRGLAAHSEPHGSARRLRLDLPEGLLKELLPLSPAVASEAQALLLNGAEEPVILTHDGARCLLSREGWEQQQERLALVLADLAARRRRAGLIDLRYDDSAVVRPAR
jgi:hypothetical protein